MQRGFSFRSYSRASYGPHARQCVSSWREHDRVRFRQCGSLLAFHRTVWRLEIFKTSFEAWLDGYRRVRPFTRHDEQAVAAFSIIGDVRVVAWKLGVARSSRGKLLLGISDLPGVVDTWLDWERENMCS